MTTTGWLTQQYQAGQDDTTRHLCAAAHLDSAYADAAIKEFVVEPTRPIPPSPGFRPASVLVEAIASRARRKLRDSVLAVLMALYVWMAWQSWLLYAWIALAVLLALPALIRRPAGAAVSTVRVVVVVAVLAAAGFALFGFFSGDVQGMFGSLPSDSYSGYDGYGYSGPAASGEGSVWAAISLVPLALMLGVVIADRLIVWQLLTARFGYGTRRLPPSDPFDRRRRILGISPPRFLRHLDRYRLEGPPPAGSAPLIVHRGYNPFVGAGPHRESWSMVLPLEKLAKDTKPDGSPFDELTTASLYEKVRSAMAVLQQSTALSPDRRLRDLKITEAVYASSAELIDHLNEPSSLAYLSHLDTPPAGQLPPDEVGALRRQPREWSRYYLCFQVETWDRDLVLSSFLHAAVDQSTLYLEWTPCVLPPIRDAYRGVDKLTPGIARPVGQALLRWLKLPATVIGRTGHTLALIRPLRRENGVVNPDAYGCLRTLREMAAAPEVDNYFQLVDVERYEKIMHSRLLPAISEVLRDCGYSPARFEKQADELTNGGIYIAGDNYGTFNVGGTVQGSMSGATVGTTTGAAAK
jgi:hypothetical protein